VAVSDLLHDAYDLSIKLRDRASPDE